MGSLLLLKCFFLFLVNFNMDHAWNIVAFIGKWQKFHFIKISNHTLQTHINIWAHSEMFRAIKRRFGRWVSWKSRLNFSEMPTYFGKVKGSLPKTLWKRTMSCLQCVRNRQWRESLTIVTAGNIAFQQFCKNNLSSLSVYWLLLNFFLKGFPYILVNIPTFNCF